jgi:hypothetical protein
MQNTRLKHLYRLMLAITAVSLLSGCAGFGGSFSIGVGGPAGKPASPAQIGSFENNSRVQLEAARYRGNVDIEANKVVLAGRGTGSTVIDGNVRISGNSCTLRGLTVSGNVYLYGNNNNITRADIRGKVFSEGNNNRW